MEHVLEKNHIFDTEGLLEKDPSYRSRLKFWTNELCAQKPQTFDIVLAVCIHNFTDHFKTDIGSSAATVQSYTHPGSSSALSHPSLPSHSARSAS